MGDDIVRMVDLGQACDFERFNGEAAAAAASGGTESDDDNSLLGLRANSRRTSKD